MINVQTLHLAIFYTLFLNADLSVMISATIYSSFGLEIFSLKIE